MVWFTERYILRRIRSDRDPLIIMPPDKLHLLVGWQDRQRVVLHLPMAQGDPLPTFYSFDNRNSNIFLTVGLIKKLNRGKLVSLTIAWYLLGKLLENLLSYWNSYKSGVTLIQPDTTLTDLFMSSGQPTQGKTEVWDESNPPKTLIFHHLEQLQYTSVDIFEFLFIALKSLLWR